MKRYFVVLFSIIFVFCGCSVNVDDNPATVASKIHKKSNYIKSIWITYYDLEELTRSSSQEEFQQKVGDLISNLKADGFNTITVQVRPCSDAFYNSKYFPTSKYFKGKQGSELTYDPLQIICEEAKANSIAIEAWINPYRVTMNKNISALSRNNPAFKLKKYLKVVNGKYYFDPSSDDVINLIVNGACEIVENYEISAIHLDDYFYPTTNKSFDKQKYEDYKNAGGELSLSNWRRSNVSKLIKKLYSSIKDINQDVKLGISPCGNIDEDYNSLYADIYKWTSERGYIDYICPQIYYGFKNEKLPFMRTVKEWVRVVDKDIVDLYVGLPLYKIGKEDKYASSNNQIAICEFRQNKNIISRQINYLSKIDDVNGFYLFSYSDYISGDNLEPVKLIKEAMQSSNLP